MTLRTLNDGNYGIFLIMGNAGFCPSTGILEFSETPKEKGLVESRIGAPCGQEGLSHSSGTHLWKLERT